MQANFLLSLTLLWLFIISTLFFQIYLLSCLQCSDIANSSNSLEGNVNNRVHISTVNVNQCDVIQWITWIYCICTDRYSVLGCHANAFLNIFSLLLSDGGMGCWTFIRHQEPEAIPHDTKTSWVGLGRKTGREGRSYVSIKTGMKGQKEQAAKETFWLPHYKLALDIEFMHNRRWVFPLIFRVLVLWFSCPFSFSMCQHLLCCA